MPFKSRAQQRWAFAAQKRNEIPRGMARRWAHETPNIRRLPERVKRKGTYVRHGRVFHRRRSDRG